MKKALEIRIRGIVQGVGFRPFVYHLARMHRICGGAFNDTEGVLIEAEGAPGQLKKFLRDLSEKAPPLADVMSVETAERRPMGRTDFVIEESRASGKRLAFYSPDVALCDQCRNEFFNPADRRHLYPFITCINCGPRFSIVSDIPYDLKTGGTVVFTRSPTRAPRAARACRWSTGLARLSRRLTAVSPKRPWRS
jgi:hydrogenase maturation protein HypF